MSARGMAVVRASLVTLGRTSSTRSPKIRRRWSRTDDSCHADCLTSSIGRSSLIRRHRPRSLLFRSTVPLYESSQFPHVPGTRSPPSVTTQSPGTRDPSQDGQRGVVIWSALHRWVQRHVDRGPRHGWTRPRPTAEGRAREVERPETIPHPVEPPRHRTCALESHPLLMLHSRRSSSERSPDETRPQPRTVRRRGFWGAPCLPGSEHTFVPMMPHRRWGGNEASWTKTTWQATRVVLV